MKIGFVGLRGVPAQYGGSETAVEEIGARLATRGHTVYVFCRRHKSRIGSKLYRGMRRVVLPSLKSQSLDTLSHTVLSLFTPEARSCEVLHVIGMGTALLLPLLRTITRAASVTTVDGFDWRREKWGAVGRIALKAGLRSAFRLSDEILIDARAAQTEFEEMFGRTTLYVPYGAYVDSTDATDVLESLGIRPRSYFLFIGRMIPDKGIHFLIDAFRGLDTDKRLVIAGGTEYTSAYTRSLVASAGGDSRITFLGPQYGEAYRQLCSHSFCYVQPSLVEGTSPQLLSALGFGRPVIASGIPTIVETVGDAALIFEPGNSASLRAQMERILSDDDLQESLPPLGRERIERNYSWDRVADLVEQASQLAMARRRQ